MTWVLTLLGTGAGGFPGEWRVGMTGAARGVWAGVLASLLLISPAEAEAEPDAAPFPALPAGRPGCCRNTGQRGGALEGKKKKKKNQDQTGHDGGRKINSL